MKTIVVVFLVLVSFKSFSQNDLKKTNELKKVSFKNKVNSGTILVQAHNKGQYVSAGNKKIIDKEMNNLYDNLVRKKTPTVDDAIYLSDGLYLLPDGDIIEK